MQDNNTNESGAIADTIRDEVVSDRKDQGELISSTTSGEISGDLKQEPQADAGVNLGRGQTSVQVNLDGVTAEIPMPSSPSVAGEDLQETLAEETAPVYLTAPAPAEGFPVDDWKGVESLHQDQISSHYGKRCIDIGLHYNGCNVVTIIDDLMKQYGHANPDAWRRFIEPDALKDEIDEAVRIELARAALHVKLLTVDTEDITPLLIAINAKDTGPYWLGYIERHVVPAMVRLGV